MEDKVLHLVVRFSDNLFSVGAVTEKHNEVVSKFGFVWFGKFGNLISEQRIEMLNHQITKGIPTFIYLVKGNRKKSTFYQADLLEIARQLPNGGEKHFPKYYIQYDLVRFINTWFKISQITPVGSSALLKLKTVSSINSIQETLVRSSSGYFLVHEAKSLF
jgi:hypothetical protein